MIKVSIVCNVFNHEKYIRDCLNGFLLQETDFEYEVLVHDDASTDHSADIIREYENKYPNIIKPIYQTENQYSQGIKIGATYQYPRAKGKYIALCEGDDYWIDPYKLQKQVDYMESHPQCTFCFTNGYIEDQAKDGVRRDFIPYNKQDAVWYKDENKEYTLDNMYEITFAPTASYFYSKDAILKVLPYFEKKCPTADLRLRLFLTSQGYAYYLKDKTCVYRQNVPNSAMTTWKKYDRKAMTEHTTKIIDMLSDIDEFTCGQYSIGIHKIKDFYVEGLLFSATSFKILREEDCKRVYRTLSFYKKTKLIIKILIPEKGIVLVRKIKKMIRG